MKQWIIIVAAASFGAFVGRFGANEIACAQAPDAKSIQLREVVLLNEKNEPAARLESNQGRTILRFFSKGSTPALEVGVDINRSTRFVHFFNDRGRVTAALNSSPPNGEATLYLGDGRWEGRTILGALRTDAPGSAAVDEWGIQLRQPGSRSSIFSVVAKQNQTGSGWTAGLRLMLPGGREWEAR
jgi:hypothetical protein